MRLSVIAIATSAVMLTGCMGMLGTLPTTPDLMVKRAENAELNSTKTSYEVGRPYETVSEVLERKVNECLNRRVTHRTPVPGQTPSANTRVEAFTAKVTRSAERTRFTLQQKSDSVGTMDLGPVPEDGWYYLVLDAYPAGKQKTRIKAYHVTVSPYPGVVAAAKQWAAGTNMGCPDLTE